jgi:hypothetical protein
LHRSIITALEQLAAAARPGAPLLPDCALQALALDATQFFVGPGQAVLPGFKGGLHPDLVARRLSERRERTSTPAAPDAGLPPIAPADGTPPEIRRAIEAGLDDAGDVATGQVIELRGDARGRGRGRCRHRARRDDRCAARGYRSRSSNVDQQNATTKGGLAFRDKIATEDSPPVANWRIVGAVFIGRANTPAFSHRWFRDN